MQTPRRERIFGLPREDLLGKNHWELFPATVGTTIETEFRRAAAEQVAIEFENFYALWERWFEIKAYPTPTDGLSAYFEISPIARRPSESYTVRS